MGRRVWLWALSLPVLLGIGCGGEATSTVRVDPVQSSLPAAEQSPPAPVGSPQTPDAGTVDEPAEDPDGGVVIPPQELEPPVPVFQPGFFQNLRASRLLDGRVTLRFKVPLTRSGSRIQIVLRAGNSSLVVHQATVARAGSNGVLDGNARQLKFAGQATVTVPSRQRLTSDPIEFDVNAPDELMVSLDVEGGVSVSLINAFPESFMAPGGQSYHTHLVDAQPHRKLWGLTAVLVEGPPQPVFLAIGDSITEGYIDGDDDYRDAWPFLASVQSGLPVVNGAVSGQGVYSANLAADEELKWLGGVTHCLVMLGTNDLAAIDGPELKTRLGGFFDTLRPYCEVWAGTLIPREKADGADIQLVHARRAEVNAWLRGGANVARVVDFEAVTQAPGDPNRFHDGYSWDGIHPTIAGQRALGNEAGKELSHAK